MVFGGSAEIEVAVEASAGVVLAPGHGNTADALLRNAETAIGSARLLLLGDLRRALGAGEQLSPRYQPKIDLGSGRVCGV